MTILTDPQDLFLRELSTIYAAERLFSGLLLEQASQVSDADISAALVEHSLETEQQIKHIERVFKILGLKPEPSPCAIAETLRDGWQRFGSDEHPSASILTMFNLSVALQSEYHEIALYRSLIQKAEMLCEADCLDMLRANLKQEETMARRIENLSAEFTRRAMDAAPV